MDKPSACVTLCADLSGESMIRRYKHLRADGTIHRPVKNFTRFDATGKILFLAAFELLKQTGSLSPDPAGTAILVVDRDGALQANNIYFDNYIKNGRSMGSPNEFIYTLPTSTCAELGIYFGIKGQLLYMSSAEEDLYAFALRQARTMVFEPSHEHVLLFVNDNHRMKAAYITRQPGAEHES